ncbi:trafficking protein particle complex subunit 6A isoform X1 [Pongo pygmaeus]|uniref:trafficking protein particle complex subunit 6A isoform X1 n=1 Tax=Pongo pygmaeus TaxID=9600 RepID=UPI0023E88B6B|nr:trafficking protein particle complex subunit 6A isoform X1 [Pongo abelii]
MADTVLFEFLHTEMVAELWAHDPGPGVSAGLRGEEAGATKGQKMSLSVLEGMGFRVGQALGERLPREMLAFREELDVLKFLCKDLWVAVFQKQMDSLRTNHQALSPPTSLSSPPGDLRPARQQLPPPPPDGLWPAVSGGSAQVPGLHLRPPARRPLYPGHRECGHRLRGSPPRL